VGHNPPAFLVWWTYNDGAFDAQIPKEGKMFTGSFKAYDINRHYQDEMREFVNRAYLAQTAEKEGGVFSFDSKKWIGLGIVLLLTFAALFAGFQRAFAQEDTTTPNDAEDSRFVAADSGMPAFYACKYGHWGCAESAAPATFIGADSGMPAFYACKYGHWGCAESAAPATFIGADSGMPAFYACKYGHWGCE
jgi:hypothetical protein